MKRAAALGLGGRGRPLRWCSLLAASSLTLSWTQLALALPPGAAAGTDDWLSRPVNLVLALGALAVLPFVFMTLTAFVKISTVLQIVRGAIGAQNVPSNVVVIALAGALTLLAMAPLGSRIATRAEPLFAPDAPTATSAWIVGLATAAGEPLRGFLRGNAATRERGRFYEIARSARPTPEREAVTRDDFVVLIPAFVVTELLEAFALGFAIYLPFLVIDLVIANVLLSLGMQMLNPTQVSLPFKLLLFVAIDGWGLLSQALVAGYVVGS